MQSLNLKSKYYTLIFEVNCFIKNLFYKPDIFNLQSKERIGSVYTIPSDMCEADRIMIYALVRGLKPKYAMEIGTRWGNSAKIITNAMEENNYGQLVGIDPLVKQFRVKSKDLHGRFKLYEGYSPKAIPKALEMLGTDSLDFIFIDGLHTHDSVMDDFNGVLQYLSPNGHILFHDTYHQGINKAISDILSKNDSLIDLGFLTRNPQFSEHVSYQGLRLIRKGQINGEEMIINAYKLENRPEPSFDIALRNYDTYANGIGKGATDDEINMINQMK